MTTMNRRRLLLTFFVVLLFSAVCFADMTIYFKDGGTRQVNKIVFKGDQAELYLLDGTLITVPVSSLDLDSSGIGAPVGTYGETKIGGSRPAITKGLPVTTSGARQAELKSQWDDAPIAATATKNMGSIHRGDTVHAFSPSDEGGRSKNKKLWYYDEEEGYEEVTITPDQAYIILYKNLDGTFGKKIMDAATFAVNFEIQKFPSIAPQTTLPLPVKPAEKPEQTVTPPPQQQAGPPSTEAEKEPEPQNTQEQETTEPHEAQAEPQTSTRGRSVLPFVLFAVGLIAAVGGALVLLKKRPKPFVDISRFSRYEQDLREFEMEIWLRHGKSIDQLMEICLKKFYQDTPAALSVIQKMLKGEQKSLVVPLIIRQSGKDPAEAEALYNQFQQRINRVHDLIQEVSSRTGLRPAQGAVPPEGARRLDQKVGSTAQSLRHGAEPSSQRVAPQVTGSTKIAPQSQAVAPVPIPSMPPSRNTSSVDALPLPSQPEEPFPLSALDSKKAIPVHSDLPTYAATVLQQLAFLSGPDEKLT